MTDPVEGDMTSSVEDTGGDDVIQPPMAEIRRQKIARWDKPFTADSDDELQNALIWYGAAHLRQVPGAEYTGQYETVTDVVLAVLLAERPHSRFITSLGPILVSWADVVDFDALEIKLKSESKLRRLGWLVDNIVDASLGDLLPCSLYPRLSPPESPSPDVIDLIRSEETFNIVWNHEASPISKKWGIVTSLQVEDFARVLAEVHSLQRPPQQA